MTSRSLGQVLESYFRLMGTALHGPVRAHRPGHVAAVLLHRGSSFIYVTHFGLSEQVYSYCLQLRGPHARILDLRPSAEAEEDSKPAHHHHGLHRNPLGAVALALCSDLGPWGMALPMAVLTTGLGIFPPSEQ